MGYFLIVLLTAFIVWNILRHFEVFEANVGVSKLQEEVHTENKNRQKRDFEVRKLKFFSQITDYFRVIIMPETVYNKHKYIIDRLEINSEILDRTLTPEELRGQFFSLVIVGIICIPLGVFFPLFWVFSIASVIIFFAYPRYYMQKIEDEDEIIDVYFLDLYLLMYSRLRLGSKARLQDVVESYISTLEVSTNLQMKNVMMKFAKFFLNNLSMYEDHVAVTKLRDRYKSATIINFCNVGSQALQGIDNSDTLLTFKMDLVRKKKDLMIVNAEKLYEKGNRAIYLIYVILFIFIISGWMSKLPTGINVF